MLRRAHWRRLPQDPCTPLAWLWQDVRGWAFGGTCLVLALGIPILYGIAVGFSTLLLLVSLLLVVLSGTAFLSLRKRKSAVLVPELAPAPAPVEAFPIRFEILYEGLTTGRDRGIASFVDGWLHVEGLRTGFSLRPIDSTRDETIPDGTETFDLPGGQRVVLRSLGSRNDRATFGETARIWRRFTIGEIVGEPVLPPLRVHASAVSGLLVRLTLAAFSIIVPLGVFVVALPRNRPLQWRFDPPIVLIGILIFFLVWGVRNAAKALDDLRRLAAIDRMAREAEEKETRSSSQVRVE